MNKDIVKVNVERFNPENKKTFTETYEVPRGSKMRALDFLNYIFEEIDPSLSYRRYLCKAKMCNGCLMMINGKPAMACWELIPREQTKITFSPLKGKAILKDLVVNFDSPS